MARRGDSASGGFFAVGRVEAGGAGGAGPWGVGRGRDQARGGIGFCRRGRFRRFCARGGAGTPEAGGRADAQGVAEGAEDAPGLRGFGDEGGDFGGIEHGAERSGDGGGSGDEADEPGEGAGETLWRAGAAGAGGVARAGGCGDEAGEAGGEAAETLTDEDDDRPGDALPQPPGGDVRAERFDDGFEAEQKSGGCGGWGGHGSESPMGERGWARRFVSFASVFVCLAVGGY